MMYVSSLGVPVVVADPGVAAGIRHLVERSL